jgi:hypothetical protein
MYLYVTIADFYCFVFFYLHVYVLCVFGYQIICEYIIIHYKRDLNKLQTNPIKILKLP